MLTQPYRQSYVRIDKKTKHFRSYVCLKKLLHFRLLLHFGLRHGQPKM